MPEYRRYVLEHLFGLEYLPYLQNYSVRLFLSLFELKVLNYIHCRVQKIAITKIFPRIGQYVDNGKQRILNEPNVGVFSLSKYRQLKHILHLSNG